MAVSALWMKGRCSSRQEEPRPASPHLVRRQATAQRHRGDDEENPIAGRHAHGRPLDPRLARLTARISRKWGFKRV